jgi:putative copper export protein
VSSDHGRILLLKLVVLAGMLALADRNRRRVRSRFRSSEAATPTVRGALRRAMGAEAALGMAVLAITAALVVTAPNVSDTPEPPPTSPR